MSTLFTNNVVDVPSLNKSFGTGWWPPVPDMRDFSPSAPEISKLAAKLGLKPKVLLPKKVDLRAWCSEVEDQGQLGSCTANAAVGVAEYFMQRAYSKYVDGSRLFIYWNTRKLIGATGDSGAWLRNTMGALVLCGVVPEKYWPYTDAKPDFDREPSAFVYAVAQNFAAAKYFSHDPLGSQTDPGKVLSSIKSYLAAGIPSMFGFFGFPSFTATDTAGGIPYPCPFERAQWGHAIVAVGYDDDKRVKNTQCNKETRGALLIRNSWGKDWGENGYGWLPYNYVLNRLAVDFWSLISLEWVDTGQFGLDLNVD